MLADHAHSVAPFWDQALSTPDFPPRNDELKIRISLDLWAAIHRLPLYEAALDLTKIFQVPRNREEEPVKGTSSPRTATAKMSAPAAATATDGAK